MKLIKFTEKGNMDMETESHQNFVSSIKYAAPMHYHDFFEFFMITSGSAIHNINGRRQKITEGTLVFIRPDDVHGYEYDGDRDCQFINIPYTKKAIKDVFAYLGNSFYSERLLSPEMPPYTILSPIEKVDLLERFDKIYMFPPEDKQRIRIQLRSILVEILTQYFPTSKDGGHMALPLWMELVLTQMQKKENFTRGVDRIYELSGRSVGHINRVFKNRLNTTPSDYVNHVRLNFAKTLLTTSDSSVVDIAMEAGFNNLSHFYHLFRAHFNTTPSLLRKKK